MAPHDAQASSPEPHWRAHLARALKLARDRRPDEPGVVDRVRELPGRVDRRSSRSICSIVGPRARSSTTRSKGCPATPGDSCRRTSVARVSTRGSLEPVNVTTCGGTEHRRVHVPQGLVLRHAAGAPRADGALLPRRRLPRAARTERLGVAVVLRRCWRRGATLRPRCRRSGVVDAERRAVEGRPSARRRRAAIRARRRRPRRCRSRGSRRRRSSCCSHRDRVAVAAVDDVFARERRGGRRGTSSPRWSAIINGIWRSCTSSTARASSVSSARRSGPSGPLSEQRAHAVELGRRARRLRRGSRSRSMATCLHCCGPDRPDTRVSYARAAHRTLGGNCHG